MLTLYSQEQATQMMLASERKDAEKQGKAEGILTLLKAQGASFHDAVSALQELLSYSIEDATEAVQKYW